MEKADRLKEILRTMFQLDRGDLDFGLYRIMNLKAEEITDFLDNELLPQVKTVLTEDTIDRRAVYEKELADAKLNSVTETDVFNHLANFFARYYDEGDFMSLRRYSGGGQPTYLIPYNGEETKLHWANSDQYYIKTTENYSSYVFTVGPGVEMRHIRFEIAEAQNKNDNVKEANNKQRRFLLVEGKNSNAVAIHENVLVVTFKHRSLTENENKIYPGNVNRQQERINEAIANRILKALPPDWLTLLTASAPTETKPNRTILDKHLATYTAKNSFDYFIHKDLGGFLRRELDLYLKCEVLNLDDLTLNDANRFHRALARTRAIRQIGHKIIDFLAQLENFQKQLWLKKKFVLETHYCVTLDLVPEQLYIEVVSNKSQLEEWIKLFAINEINGDFANSNIGYTDPLTAEFLKTNPYLVLDTRHFDCDFTDRLLKALSELAPLEEQLDGLLVHGENFHALRLLKEKYRGKVKCIYIDPPYNTSASAILYKNDYKDSSWLSLMENRLSISKILLSRNGVICCAIDDEEMPRLRLVLERIFERELGVVSVRSNPAGRKSSGQFSPTHEYALFYGNSAAVPGALSKTNAELSRFPFEDDKGRYAWANLIRSGSGDRRIDRPKMYFPIYVTLDDKIRIPEMNWNEDKGEYEILQQTREQETAVWPIRIQNGTVIEKRWHRGWKSIKSELSEYRIRRNGADDIIVDFKTRMDMTSMPRTWWHDKKYASANLGAKMLKDLFGSKEFDFAKAIHLVEDCLRASICDSRSVVFDYFAGSGTTGHAVINLNREDRGNRKCVLVEVGHHFDSVLIPRMKKVIYSPDWKEGKPLSRNGSTHFFKYIRLESYEDTLDSLELTPKTSTQQELLKQNPTLSEDYRLRYALGEETTDSACLLGKDFTDPFTYTLSIVRDGVRSEVPVDLPETFNLLIGLRLESRQWLDGVLTNTGTDANGVKSLVLWRNLNEVDNSKLEDWFTAQQDMFSKFNNIFVNGDHTLNALKQANDNWTAKSIEPVFRELMF